MPWIDVRNRSFDQFCVQESIAASELLKSNPDALKGCSALWATHPSGGAKRAKWLEGVDRLWVPRGGEAQEPPADGSRSKPTSPHDVLLSGIKDWWSQADRNKHYLAYETLRNAERFLKGPGKTSLGLYTVPLDQFRIEIDECVLTDSRFQTLREAIFPTLKNADELRARANVSAAREKLLEKGQTVAVGGDGNATAIHVARDGSNKIACSLHLVVMPYNYEDNGPTSNAIGTKLETQDPTLTGEARKQQKRKFSKLQDSWLMWKTASRSSFVEVKKVEPNDIARVDDKEHSWVWCYATDEPGRLQPHKMDEPFDIGDFDASRHFSIKTGIEWVGQAYQGKNGFAAVNRWDPAVRQTDTPKDKIEKNSVVAMLRSYHIRDIDKKHCYRPNFLTQLEVLTVNAREGGDGFQVRDLKGLDQDGNYFPALSVPYAGQEVMQAAIQLAKAAGDDDLASMKQIEGRTGLYTSNQFAKDYIERIRKGGFFSKEQQDYALFWGLGYALMVAVVKAGLLLRYALVPATPNPQNFILQLDDDLQPGQAIVRDVGDFLVHHEIAASYWLDGPSWTKCNGVIPAKLDELKFANDFLAIEYSDQVKQHYSRDLGMDGALPLNTLLKIPLQEYGDILNWGTNSTFKVWGGRAWSDLGSPLDDRMMAIWGALHNEVFMAEIQTKVGIDLFAVREKNRKQILNLDKYWNEQEREIYPDFQSALTTPDALTLFRKHARDMNIA